MPGSWLVPMHFLGARGLIIGNFHYVYGTEAKIQEVSKFQHLFPNPQLFDAKKGIWSPKTCPNTHG